MRRQREQETRRRLTGRLRDNSPGIGRLRITAGRRCRISTRWFPARPGCMTTISAARTTSRVDRQAAELALSVVPFGREVARANRQFMVRAVQFMARGGIDQFIDLGTGLPTKPNVHEVAREILPDARVLYVDNGPMVCAHARALLATNDGVAAIRGDIRASQAILDDPVTRALIDFTRPVAVLFVAVLHFLTDEDRPWEQVAAFRWRMTSGSMLAVSHITADDTPLDVQATIHAVYAEASAPAVFRTRREIETFFGGLDIVEPGLVELGAWRSLGSSPPAPLRFLGGVARLAPDRGQS